MQDLVKNFRKTKTIMAKKIYCIGDSHVSIFTNIDNISESNSDWVESDLFLAKHLGPILAYNLIEKQDEISKKTLSIPEGSDLLLCFGEIDCRAQIKKQSEKQIKEVDEIIKTCVERYMSFAKIFAKKYNIIIWGVTPCVVENPFAEYYKNNTDSFDYPSGKLEERMYYKSKFNGLTKKYAHENRMKYLSIWDKLVENWVAKKEYFLDDIHLRPTKVYPLIKETFEQQKSI